MTNDPKRTVSLGATEREFDRKADQTANQTHDAIDRATDKAHSTVDQATDKAQQVAGDVKDMAADAKDKAQQVASDVKDKAQELGSQAADRADAATTVVGEKMSDAAFALRQNAPASGPLAGAADTAADTLQRAGSYLQEQDLSDMRTDLENLIRRHPVESLLVGFGLGYLIARSMRR
jgi:gas vesicle protein